MNTAELLEAVARVGDEPEQILRFRKLIVALAISGRLDESSSNSMSLASVAGGATNDVHSGAFVRLDTIARIEKGRTGIKQAQRGPYPLVVTSSTWGTCDHFDFDDCAAIVPLVSSSGHGKATIHRLHYAEGKFALGTILAAVIPRDSKLVSARFLFEYLSAFKDELLVSRMIGTANVSLSVGKIAEVPVPVVEFSVQRKVDELMALCDQLEAARTERETARDRLSAASLARLNAPDPETFQSGAHFALNVLPALSARPDQVKQLRQTILNLAVRGKLVEQDPADEPASELLRRVSSGRRLGSAEQLRRDEGELGAARPRGWEHVAWSQVCDFVTSGSRGWAEYYATSGAWFIRAQNIRFGSLLLDNLACVRPPKSAEGSRTQVRKDDLLIVITGAGVTNPALLDRDLGEAYISQHVALVRPNYGQLSRWLLLCLMADESGRAELVRCAYGSGKPGLNLDNIRTLQSPLPPLAEQHRIVAKVDELMALCDQLEASITAGESTQSRLLDALLHDATVSTEVAV